jgi:two-component system chemotaxis sensor kinase CheA
MLLENKQVFIIEDNLQNRIIYQIALTNEGAHVSFEPWGNRALLQLRVLREVDVIILDLMLAGGISGFDVFDQIHADPEFKHIPIVAVSASDPAHSLPKAQQKGFSGFIAKPINGGLFPGQIASILNGEEVWYIGERTLL